MGENLLTSSSRYRSFVEDRDRALERIHQHAQQDIAKIMKDYFLHVEMIVSHLALKTSETLANFQTLADEFDRQILNLSKMTFPQLVARIERMRHAVYVLTFASELQAISQATKRISSKRLEPQQIHAQRKAKTVFDQRLDKRVWLNLMYLRMDLVQAFELALVQELKPQEILEKVKAAFPPFQVYQRAPKALKKTREANYDIFDQDQARPKIDFTANLIDDGDWNLALDAYKSTELPASRFEYGSSYDEDTGTFKYNWELEQELTEDFVNQVRQGQVAAAKDLGIEEFVWVAILDNKTDECCVKRHGHTTGEIEEMLDNGELDAEDCDAVFPPAHPFCRCQIGPVASRDEVEGADFQSFQDWLDS